jgi:hypothetical protein
MVFTALIALFAVDSLVTYLGIAHGSMGEYNPVVNHLIEAQGLGAAMVAIFAYKTALLAFTAQWRHQRWVKPAWRGLFALYGGCLAWSWVVYLHAS